MNSRSVGFPLPKPLFRGDQKTSVSQSKPVNQPSRTEEPDEEQEFEKFIASLGTEERSNHHGDKFESSQQSKSAPHAADAEKKQAHKERENELQHYWAKKAQGHRPSRLRNSFTAEDIQE